MRTMGMMDKRDWIGTFGFFVLGLLLSGFACIVAVNREYDQYEKSGVLEHEDVKRYVTWSGLGAFVQAVILYVL